MQKKIRIKLLGSALCLTLCLLFCLCACNNRVKNANRFSCYSAIGDSISFNIKTKLYTSLPGPIKLQYSSSDFESLFSEMQRVSPYYEYATYEVSGKRVGYIHNNSETKPCSYLLISIEEDNFNFALIPQTIHCSFAEALAFPYHFLGTMIDPYNKVENGSAFVVTCSTNQLIEFYEENGYQCNLYESNENSQYSEINCYIDNDLEDGAFWINYTPINEKSAVIEFVN